MDNWWGGVYVVVFFRSYIASHSRWYGEQKPNLPNYACFTLWTGPNSKGGHTGCITIG